VRRLLIVTTASALLVAAPLIAGIIRVPGDYATIPEGVYHATADDTVLVGVGVYQVAPADSFGWPVELGPDSPTILSEDAVGKTVLEGDYVTPAFHVAADVFDARIRIIGFTIRNTGVPILKDYQSGGTFLFESNNVHGNRAGLDASWSDGVISGCIIRQNEGAGIDIRGYEGVIEYTEICFNKWGIVGSFEEQPTIRQNWIHRNWSDGIWMGSRVCLEHNVIDHNFGAGIRLTATDGDIRWNTFRENRIGICVTVPNAVPANLNQIHSNDIYDIQIAAPGPFDYDATMNWWGTTDPDEIAAGILDCGDDPVLGCVVFDPWCSDPGCEPTAVPTATWSTVKAMFR
jgi:hypothetical protein